MRSKNNAKESIKQWLHVNAGPKTRDRIWREVLIAQEQSGKNNSVLIRPDIWRTIMKSSITKIAAAAVIIIAVLFGMHLFTGLVDVTSVAWADVVEKIDKIHSYAYRERRTQTSGPKKEGFEFIAEDSETKVYCSKDYGRRFDHYKGGKISFSFYSLPQEKALISVFPDSKKYIRHLIPDRQATGMQHAEISPGEMVKQILSNEYTELGRETIDGVLAKGAELTGQKISGQRLDNAVTRLWVDVETGLPVRIELQGLAYGTSTKVNIVQDEFIWNLELQARDFDPNIPANYTLVEMELPSEPEPEEIYLAKETSQQLNLPDIEDLNLLGLDGDEPEAIVPLVGMKEIWRAQDKIVSAWLDYSDVQEQLYKELVAKLNINNLSGEQRVGIAVALREKFWEMGGCLSKKSYPYGYAARILLESAHNESPDDMTITDELVETIQSVELIWNYKADTDERNINIANRDTLIELRMAQFEQVKKELEAGRAPVWEDFLRVNDLAILFSRAGDFESAKKVAEWLIQEAKRGGWSAYIEPLQGMRHNFNEGKGYNYNISVSRKVGFPEEFRYGRRLPSFKGPKKRGRVPVHLLEKNPVWH